MNEKELTPQEKLSEAAEDYVKCMSSDFWDDKLTTFEIQQHAKVDFKSGALSPSAANGCNAHVELAKIEFAIEQINKVIAIPFKGEKDFLFDGMKQISELTQKRNELCNG